MLQKTTVIGIAGASGAGKSRLTQRLHEKLVTRFGEDCAKILNEDCYYRQRNNLTFQQRETINYDHPDAFEHQLLAEHLRELKSGNTVHIPQYDYAKHNRKSETVEVRPSRIVILEGILVFHFPEICAEVDLKIFVDVAMDVCLARRIRRDTEERGRTVDSVLTQYEQTVRPMFFQYVEPTKASADLIIPGGGDNETAVDVLFHHLVQLCESTD